MAPTMGVDLAIMGIGMVVAIVAASLHSRDVAVVGGLMTLLAAYAVWLDRRR